MKRKEDNRRPKQSASEEGLNWETGIQKYGLLRKRLSAGLMLAKAEDQRGRHGKAILFLKKGESVKGETS